MKRALDPTSKRLSWALYDAREFVTNQFKQLTTNYLMNLRFPNLPSALRSEADLLQSIFGSMLQPRNVKAGYKTVNGFDDLFSPADIESTER